MSAKKKKRKGLYLLFEHFIRLVIYAVYVNNKRLIDDNVNLKI